MHRMYNGVEKFLVEQLSHPQCHKQRHFSVLCVKAVQVCTILLWFQNQCMCYKQQCYNNTNRAAQITASQGVNCFEIPIFDPPWLSDGPIRTRHLPIRVQAVQGIRLFSSKEAMQLTCGRSVVLPRCTSSLETMFSQYLPPPSHKAGKSLYDRSCWSESNRGTCALPLPIKAGNGQGNCLQITCLSTLQASIHQVCQVLSHEEVYLTGLGNVTGFIQFPNSASNIAP